MGLHRGPKRNLDRTLLSIWSEKNNLAYFMVRIVHILRQVDRIRIARQKKDSIKANLETHIMLCIMAN